MPYKQHRPFVHTKKINAGGKHIRARVVRYGGAFFIPERFKHITRRIYNVIRPVGQEIFQVLRKQYNENKQPILDTANNIIRTTVKDAVDTSLKPRVGPVLDKIGADKEAIFNEISSALNGIDIGGSKKGRGRPKGGRGFSYLA